MMPISPGDIQNGLQLEVALPRLNLQLREKETTII